MKMLDNLRGQFGAVLTRDEMKNVVGGVVDLEEGEGVCRIALRNADGSWHGWSIRDFSVDEAQSLFNSQFTYTNGVYVSGYCCANCPY